jgi:hypothetical protein
MSCVLLIEKEEKILHTFYYTCNIGISERERQKLVRFIGPRWKVPEWYEIKKYTQRVQHDLMLVVFLIYTWDLVHGGVWIWGRRSPLLNVSLWKQ